MISIYRSKYEYIKEFQLYGERHSGTNFLEESIKNVFGLHQTSFFGHKHFMGFAKPETITYERHTLFVGIVRDPYDWILAMYSLPHHVPKVNKKSFLDFITNEWYSVNNTGGEIKGDRNFLTSKSNLLRYKNIFELRKNKTYYLAHMMPLIASNYVFVTFESLLLNYKNIILTISNSFNLPIKGNLLDVRPLSKRSFQSDEIKQLVTNNIDWTIENSIGYTKQ
jgi:hypothetical protein